MLGENIKILRKQKGYSQETMAEQLAKQSRSRKRVWKNILITISIIFLAYIVLNVLLIVLFGAVKSSKSSTSTSTVELYCTLNDEKYVYQITYDNKNRVLEAGGDAWIYEQLQVEKYKDANALIEQIEDYFTDRGGTCEVVGDGKE